MANIGNLIRRYLRKGSGFYSALRFLAGLRPVRYLIKSFNRTFYPRWKRTKEREWKLFLENSVAIPESVDGTLRVSISHPGSKRLPGGKAEGEGERERLGHRHVWVNGPDYDGMEDNDLRGYLDGRYKNAWNQPGQIHVRVGRTPDSYKHGEWELFRVLQRWDNLWLPEGAEIAHSRLELEVEAGPDNNLELLLYEVHKDWNPGGGGVDQNNNSAPRPGEVWWNEVGHDVEPWGLPGAGFASDSHPDADTPVSPLALARYHPGDSIISFESNRLDAYIRQRIRNGNPLLFLLKLSDYLEDVPGRCLNLYSANHGDSRNTARRPRLILHWNHSNAATEFEREILLEHRRSQVFPRVEAGVGNRLENVSVSFFNADGREKPTVSIRGGCGNGKEKSEWHPVHYPQKLQGKEWTWLEIRVEAHTRPVVIGQQFTAELRDTWVRTAPPEEQKVAWTFVSPSNKKHSVLADYLGNYRWQTRFTPDELGRWQYYWTQNFIEEPYRSPRGIFDVIPGDQHNAVEALERLTKKIQSSNLSAGEPRMYAFGPAFWRLQRELIRYEVPKRFNIKNDISKNEREPFKFLDKARTALSGNRTNKGNE